MKTIAYYLLFGIVLLCIDCHSQEINNLNFILQGDSNAVADFESFLKKNPPLKFMEDIVEYHIRIFDPTAKNKTPPSTRILLTNC